MTPSPPADPGARHALVCGMCGGPHRFDMSVPSVVWNQIIRAQGLPEYLCASCILHEFAKAGRSFTAVLCLPEIGFVPIEVRFDSQAADDVREVQEENNALRWKLQHLSDTSVPIDQIPTFSPGAAPSLRQLQGELQGLVADWESEVKEFATKDDPYYNGVRQCISDVLALLASQETPR